MRFAERRWAEEDAITRVVEASQPDSTGSNLNNTTFARLHADLNVWKQEDEKNHKHEKAEFNVDRGT